MNRINLQEYEGLHYDKEKLREACKFEEARLYLLLVEYTYRSHINNSKTKTIQGQTYILDKTYVSNMLI